jgi:hypothetical protein
MSKKIKIISKVRCLNCGRREKVRMPLYASQIYYQCNFCKTIHKTLEGVCCIFCSYGSVPCTKMQLLSKRTSLFDKNVLFLDNNDECSSAQA